MRLRLRLRLWPFLVLVLAPSLAVSAPLAGALSPVRDSLPNGVASGDVDQSSAVLWTHSRSAGPVHFELGRHPHFRTPDWSADVAVADPSVPAKIRVTGLTPDTRYFYRATSPEGESLSGTFKTAAAGASPRGLRFGVSGDWRGELAPYPAVSNVPGKLLDFFVKLGDTIYADYPSPDVPAAQATTIEEFRAKHNEVYSEHFGKASWAAVQRTTPVYSMIDDHEVNDNFAGGAPASTDSRFPEVSGLINETALYRNGLEAFSEYNPIVDSTYSGTGDSRTDGRPDLYRYRTFGNLAAIFIPDARSFRDTELPDVADPLDPNQAEAFVAQSFGFDPVTHDDLPPRTLLGNPQLARMEADLVAAQKAGILWKFVMVPEPIQNIGVLLAPDRYEGYEQERSALLRFIDEQGIRNVVFVTADIHGTLVNDLSYRRREDVAAALASSGNALDAPAIPINAFEISTGPVAFDAPLAPTVLDLVSTVPGGTDLLNSLLGTLGLSSLDQFMALPDLVKNLVMKMALNQLLAELNYSPVGLTLAPDVKARLHRGLYAAAFSYGWTEFDIEPVTRRLRITTYGIPYYTEAQMEQDPTTVSALRPRIVSRFVVIPQ